MTTDHAPADHATEELTGTDLAAADRPTRPADLVALPALALGAGALVAFSLPPWGWWPLAFVGIALYAVVGDRLEQEEASRRRRFGHAWLFGAGWMYLGMGWMVQLTVPGYLAAGAVFAAYHGVAALLVPPGRWALVGRPAAHTLAEVVRMSFPFGGVPLATLGISQVGGPLAGVARVGGVILITWVVFQLAMIVPEIVQWMRRRGAGGEPTTTDAPDRWLIVAPLAVTAVVVLGAVTVAPDGGSNGVTIEVAAVQGGGEQGTRAIDVPSIVVTERHLEATRSIPTDRGDDLDLVLWPENTIDVDEVDGFATSPIAALIADEAARLDTPISVGLTEDVNATQYTNAQVVVTPEGEITSRYDKVRRVPFGEYVPFRSILERITSAVDQVGDAVAGTEPAVLELPTGERFATAISWEIFFGGRVREGVEGGGQAVLNPTNGASYTGTIVQTQQVASSRLRAIETGRWVVQAAPTGFTAFIDHTGEVRQRSTQREQVVLYDTVELRDGETWYTTIGDGPWILLLLLVLGIANAERLTAAVRRLTARGSTSPDRR